jgi:SAM-dependent methyltransferase
MSAEYCLSAIISNRQWLEALESYFRTGGWGQEPNPASLNLTPASWQALQSHLIGTGWFYGDYGSVRPTTDGQDFLIRVGELCRATRREDKQHKTLNQMLSQFPRGPAVDIGCGPGHSLLRLARLGYGPLYAYELSPVAIKMAEVILKQNGNSAYVYNQDATSLGDIQTAGLALIFSRNALQYFQQTELARTFARTLRPGGYLVAEIVGLSYYLQLKHLRSLFRRGRLWQALSYLRTVFRTIMYETTMLQPRLGAGAPEIGYTLRSIERLAKWADLEVLSISAAPSLMGYLIVLRKPAEDV